MCLTVCDGSCCTATGRGDLIPGPVAVLSAVVRLAVLWLAGRWLPIPGTRPATRAAIATGITAAAVAYVIWPAVVVGLAVALAGLTAAAVAAAVVVRVRRRPRRPIRVRVQAGYGSRRRAAVLAAAGQQHPQITAGPPIVAATWIEGTRARVSSTDR